MKADPRTADVYQQVQEWLREVARPTDHGDVRFVPYVPDMRLAVYEAAPNGFEQQMFTPGAFVTSRLLTFQLIYTRYGGQLIAGAEYQGKPRFVIWEDPSYIMKTRIDRILEGLNEAQTAAS